MKLRERTTKMPVEVGVGINGFWTENSDKLFTGTGYTLKELVAKYEDIPTVEEIYENYDAWAKEVKVRELPSGLKIADRNYYEIDEDGEKKTKFSWDEAMERFKEDSNWRLPTPEELNRMVLDLGYTGEHVFDGELFAKNLGKDSLEQYEKAGYGHYWSSTPWSNYYSSYSLGFNSISVDPQDYRYKSSDFTVRCVRREGD